MRCITGCEYEGFIYGSRIHGCGLNNAFGLLLQTTFTTELTRISNVCLLLYDLVVLVCMVLYLFVIQYKLPYIIASDSEAEDLRIQWSTAFQDEKCSGEGQAQAPSHTPVTPLWRRRIPVYSTNWRPMPAVTEIYDKTFIMFSISIDWL